MKFATRGGFPTRRYDTMSIRISTMPESGAARARGWVARAPRLESACPRWWRSRSQRLSCPAGNSFLEVRLSDAPSGRRAPPGGVEYRATGPAVTAVILCRVVLAGGTKTSEIQPSGIGWRSVRRHHRNGSGATRLRWPSGLHRASVRPRASTAPSPSVFSRRCSAVRAHRFQDPRRR